MRSYLRGWVGVVLGVFWMLSAVTSAREAEWIKKADMPTQRWGFATSVVNGKIYAIGGSQGLLRLALKTVEAYDPGFASQGVEATGKLATVWGQLKSSP
ncbi:MAG: kelch repeat-containing protein [Candidatus Poribacteria bacterium]|nr:kelch repeat-containing protein [Candidatus Poribacteria bacterium]